MSSGVETVAEFLARGGKVHQVPAGATGETGRFLKRSGLKPEPRSAGAVLTLTKYTYNSRRITGTANNR
jgi:hypothetical protein